MNPVKTIKHIRIRYILGLSAIGLLVTASFITMNSVISKQRGFPVSSTWPDTRPVWSTALRIQQLDGDHRR